MKDTLESNTAPHAPAAYYNMYNVPQGLYFRGFRVWGLGKLVSAVGIGRDFHTQQHECAFNNYAKYIIMQREQKRTQLCGLEM